MLYMPAVESMDRLDGGLLGPDHVAILTGNIKSAGQIQYLYLLTVFERATEQPIYIVASEVNGMRDAFGGGSHFLGVFDGRGHLNLGDSDDWADVGLFMKKALALAAARVGLKPPDEGDAPRATVIL